MAPAIGKSTRGNRWPAIWRPCCYRAVSHGGVRRGGLLLRRLQHSTISIGRVATAIVGRNSRGCCYRSLLSGHLHAAGWLRPPTRSNQKVGYNPSPCPATALQELAYDPRFVGAYWHGGRPTILGQRHELPSPCALSRAWWRALLRRRALGTRPQPLLRPSSRRHSFAPSSALACASMVFSTRSQPACGEKSGWWTANRSATARWLSKYLAPYVFRVAISNNRIEKLENDAVTYR